MKKKIVAALALLLILVPGLLQAATNKAEDFSPGNSSLTLDVQLTGKLKKLLEPLVEKAMSEAYASESEEDYAKLSLLAELLFSGKRFFVSVALPQTIIIAVPMTDDQFATLTAGSESHTYGSAQVYEDGSTYFTKLGEYAVISGGTMDGIHEAIDLADGNSTESLSANTDYMNFAGGFLSPRLFGLTYNMKEVNALLEAMLAPQLGLDDATEADSAGEIVVSPDETPAALSQIAMGTLDFLDMFDFMGGSFAEVSNGYKFNFKVKGNAAELAERGLSFNPAGNFTPNLYSKFPNAKPLFYAESFNPKAEYAQSKKLLKALTAPLEALGEEADFAKLLKEETGFDIEEVYSAFDREFAFGVQYDSKSPLPYLTLMGNVQNNTAAGTQLVDDLVSTLKKALKEGDVPTKAYKITENGGFTKFAIDLTKVEDDYDGPPFPKAVLTFGVSDDGLLIISNYPDIDDAKNRTGFTDLSSYLAETGPNTGIFYLNARNVWGYMDSMLAWAEDVSNGENGPPLDFYQGYYSLLESIYSWKDLFLVSTATAEEATLTGTAMLDNAKHQTYEQLLEDLKSEDSDDDGISDYDERYVYHTPFDTSDSDGDGVSDVEELRLGLDPYGEGQLFKDVSEDAYFTDEVAFLHQQGAIAGYDDGTFRPGDNINRAEFTTMIVKTFEEDTSKYLGVNVELSSSMGTPFVDVNPNEWYGTPIAKAYSAGFIAGSYNENGQKIFRPGDFITRAEALAILSKASETLKKTSLDASCEDTPFKDVSTDDWFCAAVAAGYENGVTIGKTPDSFRPYDNIVRGDAAIMIRRTLEKDTEAAAAGTQSPVDVRLFAPIISNF